MPSNAIAKTKSALKHREVVILLGAIGVFASALLLLNIQSSRGRILEAGGRSYRLEVATKQSEQRKGLSGRSAMAKNQGMLFLFPTEDRHCFWMKGMRFSLDIIWLNSQRRVVHVEENVSPNTYPESLCPSGKASQVVELNAGQAQEAGIVEGKVLNF